MAAIRLSDHFSYGHLLRFTLPSIVMMILSSLYGVADGLLVSNLLGDVSLSAVNIVWPVLMLFCALGHMVSTGGSAVVARTFGEGKDALANRYFSMLVYCVLALGTVISVAGVIWVEPIVRLAGASEELLPDCVAYGRVLFGGTVMAMLEFTLHSFFIVAEQPKLGLAISTVSGVINVALDALFIGVLHWGVAGAAGATVIGFCIGGIIPLLYFILPQRSTLRLGKTRFYGRVLREVCANGSSELVSSLSASFISILYNHQIMRLIGSRGVAAFSVMMYVDFMFASAILGFAMGSAPIVSYHYGAKNHGELKNVFRKSLRLVLGADLAVTLLSEAISRPLTAAFVGYDAELLALTVHGFRLFALCYLCNGLNLYASSFFTALCDAPVSAFLSFMRTFLLRGGMVLLLPLLLGMDGIWLAVTVAELLAAVLSITFFRRKQPHYQY